MGVIIVVSLHMPGHRGEDHSGANLSISMKKAYGLLLSDLRNIMVINIILIFIN